MLAGWTDDRNMVWTWRRGERPAQVFRVSISTGKRYPWRSLDPPDPAGLVEVSRFRATPDGRAHAYTYFRMLSNLQGRYAAAEPARAFVCVDRKLMLVPDSKEALRDRATLAMRIGALDVARGDIERLLALDPNDDRVPFLRARLTKLVTAAAPEKPTLH